MENINLTAPKHWGELTEKQMHYIAKLQIAGMDEAKIWTRCFLKFTGIKPILTNDDTCYFVKKGLKGFFSLSHLEVVAFKEEFKFTTRKYFGIKPLSKMGRYIPCDAMLKDVTFLQYLEAENQYQAYIYTKEDRYLHLLMATLYKKKGEKYNNRYPEDRAHYFASRSKEEKWLTIIWMLGVKEALTKKFKYLFAPDPQSDENDTEPEAPDMYAIIQNQMRALTDGDITKREKVLQANAWDALDELNEKIRETRTQTPKP